MKRVFEKDYQYIIEHMNTMANYSFVEYDSVEDKEWIMGNDDACVSIILKDSLIEEDLLRLLTVCSLSALFEHFHIKCKCTNQSLLSFNGLLGMVKVKPVSEGNYIIDYYVHVNSTTTQSIKTAAKKRFKVKNIPLLIQTYFKVYYHFFETQDYSQVIEYAKDIGYY